MLDIHTHILPRVDDGAKNEDMAREMLKIAREIGIDRIVATPHVREARALARVHKGFGSAKAIAEEEQILLYAGCELRVNVLASTPFDELSCYTLGGTEFLLIEFSNEALPVDWEFLISDLVAKGIRPIIAHPERYLFIQKDIGIAQYMIGYGCELQLDADSLMQGIFSAERRAARKLLSNGMASYIASDAHRPGDYKTFGAAYRAFKNEWPSDGLLTQMI